MKCRRYLWDIPVRKKILINALLKLIEYFFAVYTFDLDEVA